MGSPPPFDSRGVKRGRSPPGFGLGDLIIPMSDPDMEGRYGSGKRYLSEVRLLTLI